LSIHAYKDLVEPKSSKTSMLFSVMEWRGFDHGYLFFSWLISISVVQCFPCALCALGHLDCDGVIDRWLSKNSCLSSVYGPVTP